MTAIKFEVLVYKLHVAIGDSNVPVEARTLRRTLKTQFRKPIGQAQWLMIMGDIDIPHAELSDPSPLAKHCSRGREILCARLMITPSEVLASLLRLFRIIGRCYRVG